MPHERAVGIDLGTTFSAAAWVDESGHTSVVRNIEGDLLTPSVVLFADKEVVVGKEARTAAMVEPSLVAEWVKRDMGLPYYRRPIHGKKLPPEVIQACILQKLKAEIVRTLGDVDRVVITVPAYFDEPRRKRTCDAGEMAGLKVLDIVNEPTAAALAFGEMLGYLTADDAPKEAMTILVYDLGGGTFDATLLRLAPGTHPDHRHRRRRATRRPRLGHASGRIRRRSFQTLSQARSARRPGRDESHSRLGHRRETRAQRPQSDDDSRGVGRPDRRSPDHARAIRGDDRRSARTHEIHDPATAGHGQD